MLGRVFFGMHLIGFQKSKTCILSELRYFYYLCINHLGNHIFEFDSTMAQVVIGVRLPAFEYHQHIPRQEYRITVRNDFLFTPLNQQDQSVGI